MGPLEQIENDIQIGLCSGIIAEAIKLTDNKLKQAILKHVGDHRQMLRMKVSEK